MTPIIKKLEYPLPVMVFTEKQCTAILHPLLTLALQAMGIQGNFPRDLVHGPKKYQGLGIPNLYITQGIAHINWLLKYGTAEEHLTGKLIQQSMEAMKVEVRLPGPILSQSYDAFGQLATNCWLKHTWKFLFDTGIQMEDKGSDFKPQRDNDSYLTELFYNYGY
jgi:hypothetical protein